MKYVYILLSATPSKFGKLIRCALNERYNHMSIALDNEFKELYSFARKKNHLPLEAGFVIEDYYRFSLCKEVPINCRVYKIPLKEEQYEKLLISIDKVRNDTSYVYNLFSALSFPIFKGFYVKKAFTCVGFVAFLLNNAGFKLRKKPWKYSPNSLGIELEPYLYYVGELADFNNFKENSNVNYSYFKKVNYIKKIWKSTQILCIIAKRTFSKLFVVFE